MIQRMSVAAGLACILAACSPPAQQSETVAPPGNAAAAGALQPGLYRTTATINIPGVPSPTVNMPGTTSENCVTTSDIADFTQGNMSEANSGGACTYTSMNTAGGRIEGEATCAGPNGTQTMQLSGTYSATRVDMEMTTEVQGAGTMRMTMTSERIGDCPAGAAAD